LDPISRNRTACARPRFRRSCTSEIAPAATVDPEKPRENWIATLAIPQNLKKAIVILAPGPPDSKPALKCVLIDDSPKGFAKGESKILSLIAVDSAIEAGEQEVQVLPAKITAVPPVRKHNEFNMAQTNSYHKEGESWIAFTERQLQFVDQFRRIFIISATPKIRPSASRVVAWTVPLTDFWRSMVWVILPEASRTTSRHV
jgi:hypothetical protein